MILVSCPRNTQNLCLAMAEKQPMRAVLLYAAGWLTVAMALLHSFLGETDVFPRARIEPERLRSLIRSTWHCSAVAWASIGILLIAAPKMGSEMARASIIGTPHRRLRLFANRQRLESSK
jgi:hypothetical protein